MNSVFFFFGYAGTDFDNLAFSCQIRNFEAMQKEATRSKMWYFIWVHFLFEPHRHVMVFHSKWVRGMTQCEIEKNLFKQKPQSDSTAIPRKREGFGTLLPLIWNAFKVRSGVHSETHVHILTLQKSWWLYMKRMSNEKKKTLAFFYWTTANRQMRSRERKNWQRNLSLRTVKYFCGFFIVNIRNMLMKTHNDHQILFHKRQFAFTSNSNNKINCLF